MLLSALLFVVILSSIVFSITEMSLMQTKMSQSYQNKMQAFYNAEAEVTSNEQKLLSNQKSKFTQIDDFGVCGVTFYQIDITKTIGNASSRILSKFAKYGDLTKCSDVPKFGEGRLGFKILS